MARKFTFEGFENSKSSYSWLMLNDKEVIKKADRTFFKYKMSGIPKELYSFFNISNLTTGNKTNINIFFNNKIYPAYFYIDPLNRARIVWDNELKNEITSIINLHTLPLVKFTKLNEKTYYLDTNINTTSGIADTAINLNKCSDEELYEMAYKASTEAVRKNKMVVNCYERNAYISEYVKRKARGICELCGKEAPFKNKNGEPYLESHHIVWLSKGGIDSIKNVAALCPNCHKKMHVVNDINDVNKLLNLKNEFK